MTLPYILQMLMTLWGITVVFGLIAYMVCAVVRKTGASWK